MSTTDPHIFHLDRYLAYTARSFRPCIFSVRFQYFEYYDARSLTISDPLATLSALRYDILLHVSRLQAAARHDAGAVRVAPRLCGDPEVRRRGTAALCP